MATRKLLAETLDQLSPEDFAEFKSVIEVEKKFALISKRELKAANTEDVVELMEKTYGRGCEEEIRKALMKMSRTDLVQRLSDKQFPALSQRVETMESLIELLLETLADLSDSELSEFKQILIDVCQRKWILYIMADLQDTVFLMVQTYGPQSVEKTMECLTEMKRTDLAQRLSDCSSLPRKKLSVDDGRSALIHKVATMAAVKHLLLGTLNDLSSEEFEEFKRFLRMISPLKNQLYSSWRFYTSDRADVVNQMVDELGQRSVETTRIKPPLKNQLYSSWRFDPSDRADVVNLMVDELGQRSVETTRNVFMYMKRTDLLEKLPESSSGSREKLSVDEDEAAVLKSEEAVRQILSETLKDLRFVDLEKFKRFLKFTCFKMNLPQMKTDIYMVEELVDEMVDKLGQRSVEATREVLTDMKRSDLVQRLSESSSGSKDKQFPALSQRVETMESLIELLLETLADLSDSELSEFKEILIDVCHGRYKSDRILYIMADLQDTVFLVVQTFGSQSVEKTMEVLKIIKRTDLAQRLSDCSSEHNKKHLDEHLSALIHKVATMTAAKELLLETLQDLSKQELREFKWFLKFMCFKMNLPQMKTDIYMAELVDEMVGKLGQRSVEATREVLTDMKRSDLVQRLSESSAGSKEKHSEDECWPALIHTVEMMESVIELLLETLADLNDQELEEFKFEIRHHKYNSDFIWMLSMRADLQDTVFLMVQIYSQQSVQMTMDVLKIIKRTDLAQRLSDCSSLPRKKLSVDDGRSALIHKVATMAAVKHLLLGTLNDLSSEEFKRFLRMISPLKNQLYSSWRFDRSDRADVVNQMVDELGQRSVETTRKVFMYMKRTDLIQKLPESSSGSREKLSMDEDEAAVLKSEEAVRQILFETLKDLRFEDLEKFKWFLKFMCFKMNLPQMKTDIYMVEELVDEMVDKLGQRSVEATREVLTDMKRSDLVQRLSESSSGLKGQEAGGSCLAWSWKKQDSSDWTKLEPEVNGADADEAPTYSLQSEVGHFECSVSGLRWVCKEKASFQYQFSSWEGHMERMESRRYMPAGPLMDVTVTAGRLNEVHLPHWICTDDIPDILDQFAVLHIDDCGDVVEKVSEVTPSHVKLIEPNFSPRAVLMKVGIPVKISCNVLIYQINTAFLTLHVYLVPCDPGLQQVMRQREVSHGYKAILKPDPEKSLKMLDRFTLTADGAEVCPPELKLRYPSGKPNFFEVYTENPDENFQLKLSPKNELQPVWSCTVRKAEYQSTGCVQENHFVDKHRVELIQRVSNTGPILDELLQEQVIQQESYNRIRVLPTSQEKIRELYSGPLKAGSAAKDVFYKILQRHEKRLVGDLC